MNMGEDLATLGSTNHPSTNEMLSKIDFSATTTAKTTLHRTLADFERIMKGDTQM